jgi:hypothetical protein
MDPVRLVVTAVGLGLIVAVNLFFFAGRSGGGGAPDAGREGSRPEGEGPGRGD